MNCFQQYMRDCITNIIILDIIKLNWHTVAKILRFDRAFRILKQCIFDNFSALSNRQYLREGRK